MTISPVSTEDRLIWNNFIHTNYPPVGAFMQSWEWGDFKEACGKKKERYFVFEDGGIIAAFTIVDHDLPLKLSYGYIPRGPVILSSLAAEKILEIWIPKPKRKSPQVS